jgi:transcriptional regulator with XRE-family HTH domain
MDLGTRIRAERERLGLSRDALIQKMGDLRMDRNTLWHIEAGRTQNPRADQIIALAKALEISADYLLGLTDDPAPRPRPRRKRAAPPSDEERPRMVDVWAGCPYCGEVECVEGCGCLACTGPAVGAWEKASHRQP